MGDKRNLPSVGKVSIFKPQVGKSIFQAKQKWAKCNFLLNI